MNPWNLITYFAVLLKIINRSSFISISHKRFFILFPLIILEPLIPAKCAFINMKLIKSFTCQTFPFVFIMTLSYFYSSFIWDFLWFGFLLLLFGLCFFLWFRTDSLSPTSIAASLIHLYSNYKNYIMLNLNSLNQILIHINTEVIILLLWILLVFFRRIFTFLRIWNSVIDKFLFDFLFVPMLFELCLFMSFSFGLINIILCVFIFGDKWSFW